MNVIGMLSIIFILSLMIEAAVEYFVGTPLKKFAPGWSWALMFRDWLRADPSERASYACMKTDLAAKAGSIEHYVNGKEPWFDAADQRARTWAESTAWVPPIGRA